MSLVTIGTSTSALATAYGGEPKLLFAADGTCCAVYFDGTNIVFRTASSPYSSWSSTTTIGAPHTPVLTALIDSTDHIHVLFKVGGTNNPTYYKLTKSGSTWTVGAAQTIASIQGGGGTPYEAWYLLQDGSGRFWACGFEYNGSTVWSAYYGTDGGTANGVTSWTLSRTNDTVEVGDGDGFGFVVTGNYLLSVKVSNGTLYWKRLDTTGALTSGSWTTEQNIAPNIYPHSMALATDGTGRVMVADSGFAGDFAIRTLYYTPGSDTWSSTTDIGTGTSDTRPSLVNIGGDLYCIWSEYAASNSYALVHKKWSNGGASWGSKVTDETSGSNRLYVVAGGNTSLLAWLWTQGTATPWDVDFDSLSLAAAFDPSTVPWPTDVPESVSLALVGF